MNGAERDLMMVEERFEDEWAMPFSLIPGAAPPQYPHDLPLRPVHGRVLGRGDIGREEGLPSIMRDAQCFRSMTKIEIMTESWPSERHFWGSRPATSRPSWGACFSAPKPHALLLYT